VVSEQIERHLTAILLADIAGYSRLIGADDEGTAAQLSALHADLVEPKIREYRGRIVRTSGDGLLVLFASVVDALRCAVEIQRAMAQRNVQSPPEKRIEFRMGINVGDIIEGANIHGDAVNVAARLEAMAEIGGICVSGRVRDDVHGSLDRFGITFEDAGQQVLKNIERPVRVSRVRLDHSAKLVQALALPNRPSIAVLPFDNMSGDPEQEYFADGIVEDITTGLSRITWLFVIARNSAFTYKGRPIDVKRVGRELGVRYVLEGSVRRAANRVRVTAQLIDAITCHHVWAERYDRELADLFAVQDEITDRVMAALGPELYAAEGARAKRKPPESLDAWECLVRAISLINARTKRDGAAARTLLHKATMLDPGYAQAHSLLAFLLALSVLSGWEPREPTLSLATQSAHKALGLDNDDPWSHAAAGFVLALERRVEESVVEYERALALNPSFAYGHTMLAAALCYLGRCNDAMAQIDKAERLSPRDLLAHGNHGANNVLRAAACMVADRYREGIVFARRALAENPCSTPGCRQLVINCALAGQVEDARAALQIVKRLQPDVSLRWITEWVPFVRAEDRRKYVEGFRLAGLD
jgi:adenylate cyclase